MDFKSVEKYVADNKEKIISLLSDYAMTDTVLFWSQEEALNSLQQQKWQPVIDLFNAETGSNLVKTYELNIEPKNEKNKSLLQKYMNNLSLKELSALYKAATSMKSVLLGVGFVKNKISAVEAFEMAYLEEMYQNTLWGEEEQAATARCNVKNDLSEVEEYLKNG